MARAKVYHRVCRVCGVDKVVAEFPKFSAKCTQCVEAHKNELGICNDCGRERKILAKGLCNGCYDKQLKKRLPTIHCATCGESTANFGRGMCARCYSNWRYHNNPKKWAEQQSASAKKNPEREKAAEHKRYLKRKASGETQMRSHLYYQRHPDKVSEANRKYRKNNPRKAAHYVQIRQARLASLPHTLTEKEWIEILERYNHSCAYCGEKVTPLHREHKLPASRGGGYTKDNIVPACLRCNSRKATRTDEEFKEYLKKFP